MNPPPVIAYIFERYPVLSQTFLRREIASLTHQGLRFADAAAEMFLR